MPSSASVHIPVLPDLVREAFTMPPGTVVDATAGGGGHVEILLELGHEVIAVDRDPSAIERLQAKFAEKATKSSRTGSSNPAVRGGGSVRLVQGPFSTIGSLGHVDGILADLGFSSDQLADSGRGFSFLSEGPPDMRMDPALAVSAADLIESSSADELAAIIARYGEERHSKRLARALAGRRFGSSLELAEAISKVTPRRHTDRIHPATTTFQALRIAVNGELDELEALLAEAPKALRPGGRIAIISFHSLEDRIIKEAFREWTGPCHCPPRLPICVCGAKRIAFPLWKGAETADASEVKRNPRARSAKIRAMVMEAVEHEG